MPELPEVEIAARNLRGWALGRRIEAVTAEERARRIFRPQRPASFAEAVPGRRVGAVARKGKQILVRLDHPDRREEPLGLISHLGMTGKWLRRQPGQPPAS